ncbi:glycosyl transferase family 90 [uncultured Sanguibacteroides sp.]|uniref:glycosyl transferase family 90 n=1 Tax=uncultured Sanguibacteroides sp. TaxID=1635151 RepID=UPI0025CED5B3|nr:glycosyl transferase family 90 [uncultured Sanguibacteroides sp.]
MRLPYCFCSGKNSKWVYYFRNYIRYAIPQFIYRLSLDHVLYKAMKRDDFSYIRERVEYYNKLDTPEKLPRNSSRLVEHRYGQREKQSVYFFDTYEFTRWFPQSMKWNHLPGDIVHVPENPCIVKSRPLDVDNKNSVLLNLDKIRHFTFLKDNIPFTEKENKIIFRGKVGNKPRRELFMKKFIGHSMCDVGDVSKDPKIPQEWKAPKMTLHEHFRYKFIMALEGNDVASNLKWVMFSNSIAVMPKPTCETWFMEGKLLPDYHYIEIKKDYSDLIEKVNYYIRHEREALEIIKHAHEYVSQFQDKQREKLISLFVMKKYFEKTN